MLVLSDRFASIFSKYYGTSDTAAAGNFSLAFAMLGVLGAMLAVYGKLSESRELEKKKTLLTESGLQIFLRSPEFARCLIQVGESGLQNGFTLAELSSAVKEYGRIRDDSAAHEIAVYYTTELASRGLAEKVTGPQVSPMHRLNDIFAEQLLTGQLR